MVDMQDVWRKEIEGIQLRQLYMTATDPDNLSLKMVETIGHPVNVCNFSGLNADEVCEIALRMIEFSMRYADVPAQLQQVMLKRIMNLPLDPFHEDLHTKEITNEPKKTRRTYESPGVVSQSTCSRGNVDGHPS